MTVQAVFNGTVIAESDDTVMVERNHYFPESAVRKEYLSESDTHTVCSWKGTASYYTVTVDGDTAADAAWFYPDPKDGAQQVKGRIAFWRGVEVRSA
ncbi:MAG: DUF427 domain-containing protein [Marmoricola sp.]